MTTKKAEAMQALANTMFYEQKLEPIMPMERKEGKHTYVENYLDYAEKMLPDEATKRYYAVYEVLKECTLPLDDEPMEVGSYFRDQILLPHQERGGSLILGRNGDWLLEALSKQYLRFMGVEEEDDE